MVGKLSPHLKILETLKLMIKNLEKHSSLEDVGICPSNSRVNFDNPDVSLWIIDIQSPHTHTYIHNIHIFIYTYKVVSKMFETDDVKSALAFLELISTTLTLAYG